MSGRLDRITDWPDQFHAANYCLKTLAARCRVSPHQLARFLRRITNLTAHEILNDERQYRALIMVLTRKDLKSAAVELGYLQASQFSRDFKLFYGMSPDRLRSLLSKNVRAW